MNRATILGLLALAIGCHAPIGPDAANPDSPPAKDPPKSTPTLVREVRSIKHSAGAVFVDETPQLTLSIPVKNDLGRTVRFKEVRKTCSCSVAELDKDVLAPGEEAKLGFSANLIGRTGQQRFVCLLVEESSDIWSVEVAATLYDTFRAPTPAIVFGLVELGQPTTRSVSVTYAAKDPAKLPPAVALPAPCRTIAVALGQPETAQDENGVWCRTWQVDLTLPGQREAGPGEEPIALTVPSEPNVKPVTVFAQWSVRSLYKVIPGRLFFPAKAPTEPRQGTVTVRRLDGQPVRVNEVTVEGDGIRIDRLATGDPAVVELRIVVDGAPADSPFTREIRLAMQDSHRSAIKIPVAVAAAKR